jgi:hypothetical protein
MNEEQKPPQPATQETRSWLDDMRDHYHRTGTVRPADVYRILGDTSKVVRVESRSFASGSHRPLFG